MSGNSLDPTDIWLFRLSDFNH